MALKTSTVRVLGRNQIQESSGTEGETSGGHGSVSGEEGDDPTEDDAETSPGDVNEEPDDSVEEEKEPTLEMPVSLAILEDSVSFKSVVPNTHKSDLFQERPLEVCLQALCETRRAVPLLWYLTSDLEREKRHRSVQLTCHVIAVTSTFKC